MLVGAAAGYQLLERAIVARNGRNSELATAVGSDMKAWASLASYSAGAVLAFVDPRIAIALYVFVALMWFIPDRRIEAKINSNE